ncbi:MAG: serine/threonine-protein kinase [Gemmatimonadota bacterium]
MGNRVDMRRVEDLFLEALELPPTDRRALLDERCVGAPAIRQEVESLLDSHDAGVVPPMEEERPFGGYLPERIADYRVVRPLGSGGMGTVLLAIREGPGFEQTVALKVLRGSFVDPLLAHKLEEERRILALLEHPGIARLIDGGVTGDGHPYYAMEYVQGEDILTYCDLRHLDIRERLRLFAEVCDAVHHAHQQLVVHRDLKPSNIMVTEQGRPKLLDFGIAKNLDAVSASEQTASWVTPAYASPEQVAGGILSTRSDVYSLGILLCELLTGARPYDTTGSTPLEIGRIITQVPPARPSDLVLREASTRETDGGTSATPTETARRRGATPQRLAKRLRGEGDLIVLKALAKEPERRYDSAAALADDIRRYLRGAPLLARADSRVYRIRKLVQRHQALTVAMVLLAVALAAGTAGIVWQAREAIAERDRAEEEASRARLVTALMTDIFRLGDPLQARGDTIGVRRILEEGTSRVEATLADDPALQASLFLELGRINRNLGILDEAERLGRLAATLREAHEPGSLSQADAMGFLGLVLRDRGRTPEAVDELERAVQLREEVLPAPDTTLATLLANLGWEVRSQGEHERAGALFRRALELQRTLLGEDHPDVATTLLGLAASSHDAGNFDEAEAIFLNALDLGALDRPDPVAATALVNVGMVRRLQERYREAEPLLRNGLAMRLALFGPEHPGTIEAREQLGADLLALGRYAEADRLITDNLESAIRVLGEGHESTRSVREALATLDGDLGRFDLALARMDSVIIAKTEAHGGDHPGTVHSLNFTGEVLLAANRPEEAEGRFREALAMGARLGGNEGTYGALSRNGLALTALRAGRVAEADSLAALALALARDQLRPDHRYVLDIRRTQARILLAEGGAAEARRTLDEILEAERRVRPSPHPRIGETLALLGDALEAAGDVEGARRTREEARDELTSLPPDHPQRRGVEEALRTPTPD